MQSSRAELLGRGDIPAETRVQENRAEAVGCGGASREGGRWISRDNAALAGHSEDFGFYTGSQWKVLSKGETV